MWIYCREGKESEKLPFLPRRYPPIYNDSNYRSNISLGMVI